MTQQQKKWLLLAVPSIVLSTCLAVAYQTQKVDYNALKNAAKGTEWMTVGQSYYEQRHSTLTQINASNVKELGQAWAYEIGPGIGTKQETTPLYANGVLYGITNWSIAFAVDARTGKEIWRYEPAIDPTLKANPGARICCGVLSRGVALYEGKVFVPVIDGRLEALDAATGKVLWSSRAIPEIKPGEISAYAITMAPRVANGKVFIGNAGGEFQPFRGYVTAFDVNTGKEVWKFYMTPGDPSKPYENKALEAAAKTWQGTEYWKHGGGGSVWDGMAVDPDANILYVGTGNGNPWSLDIRNVKGARPDNLYVASIVAIDMTTGQLKWHYQCTPGDQWDYDAVQQLTLADLRIGGRDRKVIMQANKNGFFYVIDRISGEFISGAPMAPVSWAKSLDPKTGRPQIVDEAYYSAERGVTVHPVQMHNGSPMSFNPTTGLVYVNISSDSTFSFSAAESYTATPGQQNWGMPRGRGGAAPMANPPTWGPVRQGARGGILSAWDPVTQTERWFAQGGSHNDGGIVTTASNLVFQMLPNGQLNVFTADKGEKIFQIQAGINGTGAPITYMLDGKQYIAFVGGQGSAAARGGGGRGGPGGGAGAPGAGGPGGGGRGPGGPGGPGAGAPAPGGGNNFAVQGPPAGGPGGGRGPGGPGAGAAPGGRGPGGTGAAPAPGQGGAPAAGGGPKLYAFTLSTAK